MVHVEEWIELVAMGIEVLAVVIMVVAILVGTTKWLGQSATLVKAGYGHYRLVLGKALLVGLELLVAADIIRTVIIETTLANMATLGCLVLIRTFLGWSLSVEIEGHWPWQSRGIGEGMSGSQSED